jgi:AraC-like DNA-binding protein
MSRDTLSDLLRSVRLRGAVFFNVSLHGRSWAMESSPSADIRAAVLPGSEHVMEYHLVAKGNAWAATKGLPPVKLGEGDVVMFGQGDQHVISSAPDLDPVKRTPEQVFALRDAAKPVPIHVASGRAEVGVAPDVNDVDAVVVCGFLGCDLRPFNPLIGALPRMLHIPAMHSGAWVSSVMEHAARETSERRPGGDALLERLSEMMFVDAARRYLESLPEDATGWLAGLRDRYVGKALALLHEQPMREWTVDDLAKQAAISRSALYERFVQFVGLPPMQYLANWRIQLGSRMLRESNRTVAAIALEVGYESEAAFSRAFRRVMGAPPAAWRRAQLSGVAQA